MPCCARPRVDKGDHPVLVADHAFVGPHATLLGCTIGAAAYVTTGATVVHAGGEAVDHRNMVDCRPMPEPSLGAQLHWAPVQPPTATALRGAHVVLRPVDPVGDAEALYAVSHPPHGDADHWTYLPDGPYEGSEHLQRMLAWAQASNDPLYFAVVAPPNGRALGIASYLRVTPVFGVIEIGHIWFGRPLRHTTAATEAIYLLARHAFDELGYRRVEWKCDALNAASRRAAQRFGFRFEGVFRKHMVVKGRNRDTAWYAMTDDDWPAIRAAFEAWLAPENFHADGRQRRSLGDVMAEHVASSAAGE